METDKIYAYLDSKGLKDRIVDISSSMDITYKSVKHTIKVGDTFGRLHIKGLIRYKDSSNTTRKACIAECDCGNWIGPSRLYQLLSGDLISCGCYCRDEHSKMLKKKNFRHGERVRGNGTTKLYNVWAGMLQRVRDTNRPDAKYYSLKGVKVFKEWEDYIVFKQWALQNGYKDGLTIDRINTDGDYTPDNCRFITIADQQNNKSNNRYITCRGVTHTITEWTRITGLSWSVIDRRLKKGYTPEEALDSRIKNKL